MLDVEGIIDRSPGKRPNCCGFLAQSEVKASAAARCKAGVRLDDAARIVFMIQRGFVPVLALATGIRTAWTSFAHTGVPERSPTWPAYERGTQSIGVLDIPMDSTAIWRGDRCEALRELGLTP